MEESMRKTYFVDVLLPLPVASLFTYRVPVELETQMAFGKRVIVPFGRSKLYAALVVRVHTDSPRLWWSGCIPTRRRLWPNTY